MFHDAHFTLKPKSTASATELLHTLTLHFADFPLPSAAMADIVAVPLEIPETVPFWLTVAIVSSDEDQTTLLSLASSGRTEDTEIVDDSPSLKVKDVLSRVMLVTYCWTSTSQVPEAPLPSFAVAVIMAVPLATPLTTPDVETVATEVLELDQVYDIFVAVSGWTVAVSVLLSPLWITRDTVSFPDLG